MYLVKKSFAGKVTGKMGERINLTDNKIINDLLQAGYIERVDNTKSALKTKKKK